MTTMTNWMTFVARPSSVSIRFFVIVIAGLMILTTVGIDIGPAVAGLGVVGIAVGFGAQSLVRDYLNGCLILIENQFSRGDVVSVAGVTGTVTLADGTLVIDASSKVSIKASAKNELGASESDQN